MRRCMLVSVCTYVYCMCMYKEEQLEIDECDSFSVHVAHEDAKHMHVFLHNSRAHVHLHTVFALTNMHVFTRGN